MSGEKRLYIHIKELDPNKTEWKLKVRVLRKGGIETFDTRRGQLNIMKLILIDEEGTQIQALLYSHEISRFGATIEKDKIYLIENAYVNPIEKKYHNVNDEFELSLSASTNVSECSENFMMPKRCYNFLDYTKLEEAKGAIKDIIGVVVKVRQPIPLKVGKTTKRDANKREISLFDGRSNITTVALWADLSDNEAEFHSAHLYENPVVIISSVEARLYEGELSLATTHISTIEINPNMMEAVELKKRYDEQFDGKNVLQLLQPTKRMREAMQVDLRSIFHGNVDAAFCTFPATIVRVLNRDHPWYENCKQCNARVFPGTTDDTALCTQCDNKNIPFIRKPMLRLSVFDGQDEAYVTVFDALEILLGCTLSHYIEDLKKCGTKEDCMYYKNLFTCQGKEYTFLVRLDEKNARDRSRRYIIAQEIRSNDEPGPSVLGDTETAQEPKKKIKIEK